MPEASMQLVSVQGAEYSLEDSYRNSKASIRTVFGR